MTAINVRLAGWISIGAVLYHASVFLAMHFLEPEFDPIRTPGSAYVLGVHGGWMTTTYFVFSVALLAVAYGLVRMLDDTRLTKAACLVFLAAAAANCLAGIFPMDWPPPLRTSSGRLHAIGGAIAFPCFTVGTILWSLSLRRIGDKATLPRVALALSGCLAAAMILGILSMIILGFAGYLQRVFLAVFYCWMIVTSSYLTLVRPETRPEPLPRRAASELTGTAKDV